MLIYTPTPHDQKACMMDQLCWMRCSWSYQRCLRDLHGIR